VLSFGYSAGVFRGFDARGQTGLQTGNGIFVDDPFRGSLIQMFAGKSEAAVRQLNVAFSSGIADTAAIAAQSAFDGQVGDFSGFVLTKTFFSALDIRHDSSKSLLCLTLKK